MRGGLIVDPTNSRREDRREDEHGDADAAGAAPSRSAPVPEPAAHARTHQCPFPLTSSVVADPLFRPLVPVVPSNRGAQRAGAKEADCGAQANALVGNFGTPR